MRQADIKNVQKAHFGEGTKCYAKCDPAGLEDFCYI